MKKAILAAALMLAANAFAAQTNNGCQGNCPTDGGGSNATATGGSAIASGGIGMGGQGGAGGQGGSGGAGGNSVATGGAGGVGMGGNGGAVVGSGNSANQNTSRNENTNVVSQGQNQGQGQSQSANSNQGQSQSSKNDNRSSASNRNSNAAQGNTTTTSVSVAGDTVTYEAARIPVSTAYAAGLTASNGTCMGSTSAGGQGMSFGFSVGTTWKDPGCDRRYNAQSLAAVGQAKAAVALLCQDPDIKAAMETAGTPCQATKAETKAVAAAQDEIEAIAKGEPVDAIRRYHLGLPPLAKR